MVIAIGLGLITLFMLSMGYGLLAAFGFWGGAIAYVILNPAPNMTIATWLAGAGLVALVIQLALGLTPEKKKDEKKK